MDLSFFPLTLEAIDHAAAESLCLFIASDERPLTGLAGLADWRLSGRLSRLLRSGLLTGDAGEAVLTPPGARLGFQKLFLFGVGPSGQDDAQLVERVSEALRKLAQAGVREAALQLPLRMSVDTGMRVLVDELQGPGRAMLFAPDPQKLVAALSQAASRGSQPPPERRVKVPTPAQVKPVSPPVKAQPYRTPTPPQGSPAAQPIPVAPAISVAVPRASPLPFAPQADLPAPQFTPPPPAEVPRASPLPFAPSAEPQRQESGVPAAAVLPTGPATPPPPLAPSPESTDAAEKPPEERRPAPPPPQRYVPPAPKPHVFDTKHRKKP